MSEEVKAPAVAFSDEDLATVLAIYRQDGTWRVGPLVPRELTVDALAAAVRNLRREEVSFGVVNLDNDFLVILRPVPGGLRLVLSDATAGLGEDADDLAVDVLEALDHDTEAMEEDIDLDEVDPWAEGDLDIFADLGVPGQVLEALTSDPDMWADELLDALAEEMGFADELEDYLDSLDDEDDD